MFFRLLVLVAVCFVASNGQLLRIRPLSLGSTRPSDEVIIRLQPVDKLATIRGTVPRPLAAGVPLVRRNVGASPIGTVRRPKPKSRPVALRLSKPQTMNVLSAYAKPKVVAPARTPFVAPSSFPSSIDNEKPEPYNFQFQSTNEFGSKIARQETGDASGKIVGSYSLQDSTSGVTRVVNYVADDDGFRAQVQTNEPGTKTSEPADVLIQSNAQ